MRDNATIFNDNKQLYLLLRPHCYLCEQAQAILSALNIAVKPMDIDDHAHLKQQYDWLIPVLYAPWCDAELCYPFDASSCQAWLSRLPPSQS